jgi:hypothetical protein
MIILKFLICLHIGEKSQLQDFKHGNDIFF